MARLPRLDLPGVPQHVVQRGNNRLPCFLDDDDRRCYLTLLREALLHTDCRLHAYVLMDNHVHLLATPSERGAVGRMMQRLGRNYVALFNARHGRTGTLWEGRYKACLVDSDDYVLRCYRYIELNPVRARMVVDPAHYAWSSCATHLGLCPGGLLQPHPSYLALGTTEAARATHYAALLHEALPDTLVEQIRAYLQQQRALGHDAFQAMVEKPRHVALRASDRRTAPPSHAPPGSEPDPFLPRFYPVFTPFLPPRFCPVFATPFLPFLPDPVFAVFAGFTPTYELTCCRIHFSNAAP